MTIELKPDRVTPALPSVTGDAANHTLVLRLVKECIEVRERRTGEKLDSFIKLRELVDLGILKVEGNRVVLDLPDSSGSGGVTDHGELTGLLDDDHTQYVLRSILTADGDLFARVAGVISRIGIGSTGQVLTVSGGLPVWADPPSRVEGVLEIDDLIYLFLIFLPSQDSQLEIAYV